LWHRRPWRRSTFVDAPIAYGQIQIRWKRMNETDQIKIPSNIVTYKDKECIANTTF
jgi:hypothetical protein